MTNSKLKTNASVLAAAALYATEHDVAAQPATENPTIDEAMESIKQAFGLIANATTLAINVPSPDGDTVVEFVSDEQNGEVVQVACKVVNRLRRLQIGLLGQIMRQLDFAVEQEMKELKGAQDQIASAMRNLQRSQDPAKLRDFIESKLKWADVISDRAAWAGRLRDAGHDAYLDLVGQTYVPVEKRTRTVEVPASPTGASPDPLLARAAAFVNQRG